MYNVFGNVYDSVSKRGCTRKHYCAEQYIYDIILFSRSPGKHKILIKIPAI